MRGTTTASFSNTDWIICRKSFVTSEVQLRALYSKSLYRGNHKPIGELTGGIAQIEKYIYYLNHLGSAAEAQFSDTCKKNLLKNGGPELPGDFQLRCLNPHGILLIGHCEFTEDEQRDFDLIRRQHAHVADVITYDDMLERLKRMAGALGMAPMS